MKSIRDCKQNDGGLLICGRYIPERLRGKPLDSKVKEELGKVCTLYSLNFPRVSSFSLDSYFSNLPG
jgi:hypothetical protein